MTQDFVFGLLYQANTNNPAHLPTSKYFCISTVTENMNDIWGIFACPAVTYTYNIVKRGKGIHLKTEIL